MFYGKINAGKSAPGGKGNFLYDFTGFDPGDILQPVRLVHIYHKIAILQQLSRMIRDHHITPGRREDAFLFHSTAKLCNEGILLF